MDWKNEFFAENEQPLDRFVTGLSNTAIFRTIGCIGDSLSSGEFESRNAEGKPGWHDYYEYSWGQHIARKNGVKAYNFSRGGMSAKEYIRSFADANRYWSPEMACQAYILALGVNDIVNEKQECGSVADIDPEDWRNNQKTFAGYYAAIIMRLKKIQPLAKFFLVTIPKEGDEKDVLRESHAKLLYELAEYFDNCYVIDLYKYGPVYDDEFKKRFYLYGHMNASGYVFSANMIDSYIDYIIRKNPEDFKYVPYIGTDLQ